VTTIGFHPRRAALPAPRPAAHPRAVSLVNPQGQAVLPAGWVRVGTVQLRSAASYLVLWAVVLFAVLVCVLVGGYSALSQLGVTGSVSRALAVLTDEPLPPSGVLPVLQPDRVLPTAVLVSAVLSGVWLVLAFAAVLVHNAITKLTGGIRVRIRPPR
jgi:predicted secreted protein